MNISFKSTCKAKLKYKAVSGNMLKKIRVGRSEKYFTLFLHFTLEWCKMEKMWSLFVI